MAQTDAAISSAVCQPDSPLCLSDFGAALSDCGSNTMSPHSESDMYGADTLKSEVLSLTCRDSGWAIRVERAIAGLQKSMVR